MKIRIAAAVLLMSAAAYGRGKPSPGSSTQPNSPPPAAPIPEMAPCQLIKAATPAIFGDPTPDLPGYISTGTGKPSTTTTLFSVVVASFVQRADPIMRATAPDTDRMNTLLNGEVGATVKADIVVMVAEPVENLKPTNGIDLAAMGKYVVVGRINWKDVPVMSDRDRLLIQTINKKMDEQKATISSTEAERARLLMQVREGSGLGRPLHYVYLMSDDPAVLKWGKNVTYTVTADIQVFSAFIYPHHVFKEPLFHGARTFIPDENNSGVYVGVEAIIKAGGVTTQPATQP